MFGIIIWKKSQLHLLLLKWQFVLLSPRDPKFPLWKKTLVFKTKAWFPCWFERGVISKSNGTYYWFKDQCKKTDELNQWQLQWQLLREDPEVAALKKFSSVWVMPQPPCHVWEEQKHHIFVRSCCGSPLPIHLPELEASERCISEVHNNREPQLCSSTVFVSMWEKSDEVVWKTLHNLLGSSLPPRHINHCTQFTRTGKHMHMFYLRIR